jgi:hypothetical protein
MCQPPFCCKRVQVLLNDFIELFTMSLLKFPRQLPATVSAKKKIALFFDMWILTHELN